MWEPLTTMQKYTLDSGYCRARCVRSHLLTCTVTCPHCGWSIRTASMTEVANVLTLKFEIYCPVLTSHGSTNPRASKRKGANWRYSDVWPSVQFRSLGNWERNFFWVGSQDSVHGTATLYGPDGPEFELQWCSEFLHPYKSAFGVQPAFCTIGTGFFRGSSGWGVNLNHSLGSSAEVKQE
jgi:hypothetical protein